MPGLNILLKDVLKKYSEFQGSEFREDRFGILYGDMKHKDATYDIAERPYEGWLSDKKGNPQMSWFYAIHVNDNMKEAPILAKVGVIADALSLIATDERNVKEMSLPRKIGYHVFELGRLAPKVTSEDTEADATRRGFGREIKAMNEYLDGLKTSEQMLAA